MFDKIIMDKKPVFMTIDYDTWFNFTKFHKIGIYENKCVDKTVVTGAYVVIGFYREGKCLLMHGDSKLELQETLKKMMEAYNGQSD